MTARLPAGPAQGRLAFWLVAVAFLAALFGGALPTPLYPAYAERFDFGPLTLTLVFALYSAGALSALLTLGPASDALGRRALLLAGLLVAAVSSLVFVLASTVHTGGVTLLLVGRALSGLSVGVITGTATAALTDFAGPDGNKRASLTAATAAVVGIGLGPFVGGFVVRHDPDPLTTVYLLHVELLIVGAMAVLAVAEPVTALRSWRPRLQRLVVPPQARAEMLFGGAAGFAGFAVLGLFTAVTPGLLALLGHRNPALTGSVVFVVFVGSAVGQGLSSVLTLRVSLLLGTALLAVGAVVVALAIGSSSLGVLLLAATVAGFGQGLSFRAALGAVTAVSPATERGAVASTFFAICYVGLSLPVVAIGVGIEEYGLVRAGEVFAGVVAAVALLALLRLARSRPVAAT